MKKAMIFLWTLVLMLALAACAKSEPAAEPAAAPTAEAMAEPTPAPTSEPTPTPEPEQLAAAYVEMLKSGTYQYSYVVPYEGIEMTTTEAAKDGSTAYRVLRGETGARFVQKDGKVLVIDEKTGEMTETTAEKNLGGSLDFADMAMVGTEERDGKVFETYSMRRNAQEREFTFVFENGALIGLAFSYVEDESPYFRVTEFTGTADEALFETPDYDVMFEDAIALYDAEEYDKSFPLFQTLSKAKYAAAMAYLGDSYYYGEGVAENEEAALVWYQAAADAGDPFGQACLGDCYCFGYCGVEVDYEKALELYRLSAEAGDAYGTYSLGWVYDKGKGIEQDYALAMEWYKKAAELEYVRAMNQIGYLYDVGLGVREDDAEAVKWYARAAEAGDRIALYNMGLHTYYGQGGLKKDREKAKEYLELSAAKGYQEAIDKLFKWYGVTYTPAPADVKDQTMEISLSWSTGTIRYTGAVDETGLPNGEGTGIMEADAEGNAWTYTGGWEHGHLSGAGELTHVTEDYVQSGTFQNDYLTNGSQTQNGVLRYEGEWQDGDLHGQGKLYTRTGELLFEGKFDHNQLVETQKERERRAAPFMETCEDMDETLYAKWKDGTQAPGGTVAVWGFNAAMSEQGETGSILIYLHGDENCPLALSYRYAVDEKRMTAKSDNVSAWGYCVGMFSYTKDGKPASCPQIEVVYWTTK